jgi:Uma2 family endonuclease
VQIEKVDVAGAPHVNLNMPTWTLELPSQKESTAFNLARWAELLANRDLARFEGRVETDRHGQVIMRPPPAPNHGSFQSEISYLLRTLMKTGRTVTECPVSTADEVKAADVAWASPERIRDLGASVCFATAPEICVEILSSRNSDAEIKEKMVLYFDARAHEVWICNMDGAMAFFAGNKPIVRSELCPEFPKLIDLR